MINSDKYLELLAELDNAKNTISNLQNKIKDLEYEIEKSKSEKQKDEFREIG